MDKDSLKADAEFTDWVDSRQWCEQCDHFRRPSETHDYGFGWCVMLDDFTDSEDGENCDGYWHV